MPSKTPLIPTSIIIILLFIPILATAQTSDNGLVAEWHFDEGKGNIVKDTSGNGNDGTIHGATWVDGKYGKALSFDGKNDYVTVPDSSSLDITGSITVELWVKWDSINGVGNENMLFGKAAYGVISAYYMELGWGKVRATIGDGAIWHPVYSTTSPATGVWYFLSMTSDGSSIKIFVNGKQENSAPSAAIATTNNPLNIGRFQDGSRYVNGILDEVRIYNRALSAEDLSQPPPCKKAPTPQ